MAVAVAEAEATTSMLSSGRTTAMSSPDLAPGTASGVTLLLACLGGGRRGGLPLGGWLSATGRELESSLASGSTMACPAVGMESER